MVQSFMDTLPPALPPPPLAPPTAVNP
jgi:hypothetical protein